MARPAPDINSIWADSAHAASLRVEAHLGRVALRQDLGFDPVYLLAGQGWVCGSQVWMPALGAGDPLGSDLDVAFTNPDAMAMFVRDLSRVWDTSTGSLAFDAGTNAFGATRFTRRRDGKVVCDVMDTEGRSIAEFIGRFSSWHEKMAYAIGQPANVAFVRLGATPQGLDQTPTAPSGYRK